ncbi:hypothetical protein B0H13DRAFT_2512513 [Mycena leptocephala]|nr:hypothetical protein B0H13DRAFT_2512513 [Mycena leptocephala]
MIHTKRRNRLNPMKVHNTSLVRSDRLRAHAAAGLMPKRKLRRCSLAEDQAEIEAMDDELENATPPNEDSMENDFEAMANVLINLAASEHSDTVEGDDLTATASPAPIPPPSASTFVTDPNIHILAYKKITLEKLFHYPPPGSSESDLDFFWRVGRAGVDAEEEEILNAQQGGSTETVVDAANSGT